MSPQPQVHRPGTPFPELHTFMATQRAQLDELSRAAAMAPMQELLEAETRVAEVAQGGKVDIWSGQVWRRNLRNPRDYDRQVDRDPLVSRLLMAGHTTDAELAWLASGIHAAAFPSTLSIRQVVQFAESLNERIRHSRSDDELLQLVHLRRNAEDLAWRMLEWANRGQL